MINSVIITFSLLFKLVTVTAATATAAAAAATVIIVFVLEKIFNFTNEFLGIFGDWLESADILVIDPNTLSLILF